MTETHHRKQGDLRVNDEQFWAIIDQSLGQSDGHVDDQREHLRRLLNGLSDEVLVGFHEAFVLANRRLYTWRHFGAATVALGVCGDDSFTDFRSWVISRGRRVYARFLQDPDSIVEAGLDDHDQIGAAERFSSLAAELFEDRPGAANHDAFPGLSTLEPDDQPAGARFDHQDAALAAAYPRLTARCGTEFGEPPMDATPWISLSVSFDEKTYWDPHYAEKWWRLLEQLETDHEWNQWFAESDRVELQLWACYSRKGHEKTKVTVSANTVSVKSTFKVSRFQESTPAKQGDLAIADFLLMIAAVRSRIGLVAPPELPTLA